MRRFSGLTGLAALGVAVVLAAAAPAAQTVATAATTGDAHAVEPLLEAPDPWRGDFLDWVGRTPRPSAVVSSIERVGDGDRQRVTVTAPGSRETRTFTLDRRDHWWGPTYAVIGD